MTGVAIFSMCAGTIGYLGGALPILLRVVLFASAVLFFLPGVAYDAAGALLLVAVLVVQRVARRNAHARTARPASRSIAP